MPLIRPGSDWDVHGCINSAGYVWCQILGKCLRTWEEACKYPSNCLGWYDGCNTCNLIDGELGACTEMYCYVLSPPLCSVPGPEQIIDYAPIGPVDVLYDGAGH